MGYKSSGDKAFFDFYKWTRKVSAEKKRVKEFKAKGGFSRLTKEQEEAVRKFYAPYKIPDMVFHSYFTDRFGEFHAEFIPQDIYVGYIDPYFNDIVGAKYLDNKCYYDALFHGIPQCETVFRRVNGMWLDKDSRPAPVKEMARIIEGLDCGIFVKEAQTSAGGSGVTYIPAGQITASKILTAAKQYRTDVIVQKELKQHEAMAKLNASSVNSLRIYSLLGTDGVAKIYSAVVRMGVEGGKLDNYSAGGMTCGITEDGHLRRFGVNKAGDKLEEHPTSHTRFEGYEIPSFAEAKELIKKAHPMVAHYRSIMWDIAIREDGVPVLIEANLCRGGIDSLQSDNGPLYGEDTVKVLDEVFGRNKKNKKK